MHSGMTLLAANTLAAVTTHDQLYQGVLFSSVSGASCESFVLSMESCGHDFVCRCT